MAGFTKTEFIWMNGALRPWADAQVHITAHGLHYGTGVFEGMRSYDTPDGPAIFRLDAHMRRFAASGRRTRWSCRTRSSSCAPRRSR